VKCLSAKQKTNKCTLSLSLKNTRAGSKFTNSADPKGADHPQKLPSIHEIYENRAVEKMSKIRSCAHFSSSQKENKLLWLKCLLNVIITPIVILWWCRPFTSTQSERHQLVTFTDGSDMYIHFKVLYIAVMLGIVQKEE
jgi:hypothetical protein